MQWYFFDERGPYTNEMITATDLSIPTSVIPDGKVHGSIMGPIWGRQDPGGPHVGPMSFAIWDTIGVIQHIETEAKRPTFCKRHIQKGFLEENVPFIYWIIIQIHSLVSYWQ